MFHVWRMDNGNWTYLGALTQSPLERNLVKAPINTQFYVMAA